MTYAHTCTGSDRILFVGTENWSSNAHPTGITYNGVAMNLVTQQGSVGFAYTDLYFLANPASGANNVVISWAGSTDCGSMASSYTGASNVSTVDSSNLGTDISASTLSVSTTSVADNCWGIAWSGNNGQGVSSVGGGTGTSRAATNGNIIFDSNGVIHPAGSRTFTVNVTNSGPIMLLVASFAPKIAVPSGFFFAANQ